MTIDHQQFVAKFITLLKREDLSDGFILFEESDFLQGTYRTSLSRFFDNNESITVTLYGSTRVGVLVIGSDYTVRLPRHLSTDIRAVIEWLGQEILCMESEDTGWSLKWFYDQLEVIRRDAMSTPVTALLEDDETVRYVRGYN